MKSLGKGGTAVTLVFVGAIDIAQWLPKFRRGDASVSDLLVQIGMDVTKAVVATALAAAAVGAAVAAVGSAPVWAVVGATIGAGVLIGAGLDWLDNAIGLTEGLKDAVDELEDEMAESVNAVEDFFGWLQWEYNRIEEGLENPEYWVR